MEKSDISDLPKEAQDIYNGLHVSVKILVWVFKKAVEEGLSERQALQICEVYLRALKGS